MIRIKSVSIILNTLNYFFKKNKQYLIQNNKLNKINHFDFIINIFYTKKKPKI